MVSFQKLDSLLKFVNGWKPDKPFKNVFTRKASRLTLSFVYSLFPLMPRHNYWKVAPLVKSLCAKHGIKYTCKPLMTALQDILQYVALKKVGAYNKIWLSGFPDP